MSDTAELAAVIDKLRSEAETLRAEGVVNLSVFGSVARGEQTATSDVDLAVVLSPEASSGGFSYFGRIETIREMCQRLIGRPVDIVIEPARRDSLRSAIERDRAVAF